MATIQEAIEYAKKNPDTAFATELRKRIETGKMNTELSSAGLPTYNAKTKEVQPVDASFSDKSTAQQIFSKEFLREVPKELYNTVVGNALKFVKSTVEAPMNIVQGIQGEELTTTEGKDPITGEVITSFQTDFQNEAIPAVMEGTKSPLAATAGVVGNTVLGAVDVVGASQLGKGAVAAGKGVANLAKTASSSLDNSISSLGVPLKNAVSQVAAPEKIMQRVARISKGKQAAFEKTAGESIGTYLTKRGIYGDIDGISTQLFNRFEQSKAAADDALAGLTGTFEPQQVKTALTELAEREARVSAPGAPSQSLARVGQLQAKMEREGLTMSEINEVKRLYERNVKLDFVKQNLPEGVARANNIDDAIRTWQFDQAETLGLKNLPQINKETRLAKQLLDDIGAEYAGNAGNNAMTLTDWIMLSGGDPTAVGGFLAKKTLSSKKVQSSIAKSLNRGKPIMGDVKADIGTSQVKQLPAGKTGVPASQNFVPQKRLGASTMEKGVSKTSMLQKQLSPEKSQSKSYNASKPLSKSTSSSLSTLEQEAKKYKSVEEFVKAQGIMPKDINIRLVEGDNIVGLNFIEAQQKGAGLGSKTMNALKDYADAKGKTLVIGDITNQSFYDKFDYLKKPAGLDTVRVYSPANDVLTGMEKRISEIEKSIGTPLERTGRITTTYNPKTGEILETDFGKSLNELETLQKAKSDFLQGRISKSQLTDIWNKANQATPEQSLLQEAKKYKSAEEFVKAQETKSPDYAIGEGSGHTAPYRDDYNAPAYDLTKIYPKDVYEKGVQYYGSGYKNLDNEAMDILKNIKDNPNAEVTIYRAVPKGKGITNFNKGDWVTLTKGYAKEHGISNLNGKYEILSKKVKADEIFTDANSLQEFGYDPRGKTKQELTDIYNKAKKKK